MNMGTPHKHAEIIKAWAEGAKIQHFDNEKWYDVHSPLWDQGTIYRIKPEPKPDLVYYAVFAKIGESILSSAITKYSDPGADMLKLIFDGETGQLKSAEVLK
jgi:hypothetical protein